MLDFDNIPVDPALMSLHQAASASTSAQVGNATSSWNGKTTRANGRLATSMGMGMIDPSLWALQPDATGEKAKPAGRTVAGDEKMAASDSAPASAPASMTWMGGESHGTHGDGAEAEAGISLDAPQGGQYPQPDQHHDPVQNQGRESEHEQQEGAAAGAMVMSETEDYGQIEDTDVEIDPALREIVNSLTKAQEAQQAAAEPGALQEANPHSHPIADTDMITQQLDGGVVLDAEHMQLDELSAEHFAELLQNASAAYNDTDMPGMLLHDHDHLSLQSGEGHVDDGQIGVGIGVGVGVGIGLGAGAGMHSASHSHGHRTHRGQATHHPGSDTSHLPHNINGPLDAYTTHIASTSTSASGVSTPHSDQPHVGMEYMDGLHTHSPPVGASGDGATGVHADPFGATANAAMHDHIHTPVHGLGTGAVEYSAYDLPNGGSHFTPDTDTPPVPPKRGRGRPRGSKNKPRLRLAHPSQPSHIEFPYIPASSGHGLASSSTSSSLGFTLSTPLDPCSTSTSPSSSSFPAPAPPPAPAPGRTRPARPDPKPAGPIGRPPRVRTGEELEKWLAQRAAKAAGISRGRGRPRKFPGYLVREMRLVKNREEFKKVVAAAQAEQGGREGRDGREEPEEGVDADGWNGWSKRPEGKVRRDAEGGSGGRGEEGQEEGDGRDDRARKRRRMDNGSAEAEAGPSGSAENFGQLEMDYGERQHRQHSIDNPHGYSGRREGDPGESSLHDHVHDHADPAELGTMAIDMHGNISLQEQDDWDWQQHGMNDHGGPDRLMDNHDDSLAAQHGHTPHGRTSISDRLSDPSGSGAPEYAGHGGGPGGNMDMEADIESHRLLEAVRDHFRSLPHSPAGV